MTLTTVEVVATGAMTAVVDAMIAAVVAVVRGGPAAGVVRGAPVALGVVPAAVDAAVVARDSVRSAATMYRVANWPVVARAGC